MNLALPTLACGPSVELNVASSDAIISDGDGWVIHFGVGECPFGPFFLAWCAHGLCRAALISPFGAEAESLALQHDWPNARLQSEPAAAARLAQTIFDISSYSTATPISAWVKATPFQRSVWQRLLEIPFGATTTYGRIAASIGCPSASRAVGNAVGKNPLAFVIPCHRIVPQSGGIGNYRWSPAVKCSLLEWEAKMVATQLHEPFLPPH